MTSRICTPLYDIRDDVCALGYCDGIMTAC